MSDALLFDCDKNGICRLTINRPEKRNAFDDKMIVNIISALQKMENDDRARILILSGNGDIFSAGADLNWMRNMVKYDHETNCRDALQMATMLHALYSLTKPTIARINGPAFGGAIGLIACCDIAVATTTSRFAFTEVKLGIIPAVISPYIVNLIGHHYAKRLFLSAEALDCHNAVRIGLIDECAEPHEIDACINRYVNNLLLGGPSAQRECKRLIQKLGGVSDDISQYTAELIAQIRTSDEGQEGLNAFLEKRQAAWLLQRS